MTNERFDANANTPAELENPNDPLRHHIDAARHDEPASARTEAAMARLGSALRAKGVGAPDSSDKVREGEGKVTQADAPALQHSPRARRIRHGSRLRPRLGLSLTAAALLVLVLVPLFFSPSGTTPARAANYTDAGELRILGVDGRETTATCPLEHTAVEATISGFISRTIVRQQFTNPMDTKIEAVYVFPLPQDAAVDTMVLTVGGRRVVGVVKPREEARQIYQAAQKAGHVAALLNQERPNIFTQHVANIEPGARIDVEISYVETLRSDNDTYKFVFPMTVAPRYIPGSALDGQSSGTGTAADTDQVPDASNITPPVAPVATRAGHNVSLQVYLDAGTEIFDLASELHEVTVDKVDPARALVALANKEEIPNRDFVLKYRLAGNAIGDAFLVSTTPQGQFFTLMLQPPRHVAPIEARPKEMIFVIDRSGSMNGFPIEKAKETMRLCIEQMNPNDTFNLLSFSGGTGRCFESPMPNSETNRATALQYLSDLTGSGGTEMMPAILEALGGPSDPDRLRIVCFMTDGQIGNDLQIVDAVKQNAGTARVFAFGIGNSVNRFLLDRMAQEGRGEVEYVTMQPGQVPGTSAPGSGQAVAGHLDTLAPEPTSSVDAASRFAQRIASPVLTDIQIDWGNLPVEEVYPQAIPDLFSETPVLLHGRLAGQPQGTITLRGNTAAGAFERQIEIKPAKETDRRDALDSLWARAKIKHLMRQNYAGFQSGHLAPELKDEITSVGVEYSIVTQYTSFVAVDTQSTTKPGDTTQVNVPVESPDGQVTPYSSFRDITFQRTARSRGLSASASASEPMPAIAPLPDIQIGDFEDLDSTDSNLFVFADSFQFSSHVPDDNFEAVLGGFYEGSTATVRPAVGTGTYAYDPTDGTVSQGDVWRVKAEVDHLYNRPRTRAGISGEKATDKTITDELKKTAIKAQLAPELQPFAIENSSAMDALDSHGNLTSGTLQISNFQVRVKLTVSQVTADTLRHLHTLGFNPDGIRKIALTNRPTSFNGRLDIRKLHQLMKQEIVRVISVELLDR